MSKPPESDQYSEAEAKRRYDATLRRMLNTPPAPNKKPAKPSPKPK